jgi:GH18 family chitinase
MIAWTHSTVPNIMKSIDFVNVMTYDLMNRRDNATKHHSGVSDSWNTYTEYAKRGVLPWDMNLGFGFYVKWFKTSADSLCSRVPAIGCPTGLMEDPVTGVDLGKAGAFSWHDEVPGDLADSFQRAMKYGVDDYQSSVGEYGYDSFEGHCYMDQEERIFWTWDTAKAITIKTTQFLDKSSVGGVFAWGLGEDAPRFEHLKAVNEALEAMEKSEVPPYGSSCWKSDEQRTSYAAQYLGPLLWDQLTLQGRPPICRPVNSDGLLNAGTQRRS